MAAKALSPKEVHAKRMESIPDYVINTVNDMLVERYGLTEGGYIEIAEDVLIKRLHEEMKHRGGNLDINLSEQRLRKNGWLNFGLIFQNVGWEVIRVNNNTFVGYTFVPIIEHA